MSCFPAAPTGDRANLAQLRRISDVFIGRKCTGGLSICVFDQRRLRDRRAVSVLIGSEFFFDKFCTDSVSKA